MADSSVIIPVHNLAGVTDECLRHVLRLDPVHEVIVVDDASSDDTAAVLEKYAPRVRVVRHAENRGFAESCNDGARAATGKYLVFLNNDTVPRAGWLDALEAHAAAHPQAAVIGSRLLYPDGTIQHAGVVIGQDRYPRHLYAGFPGEHPAVTRSRRFQVVTAACMLVRRAAFESAGGFDPAFRNGFEDVDLCLRLGAAGGEIHYCAASVLCHLESVSPGRFKNRKDNVDRYRERWMPRVRPDDLDYYIADGLLRIVYEGRYPVRLEVSPLLATLHDPDRRSDVERLLRERNRQLVDLQRENTRMRLELGSRAGDSPERAYQRMRERVVALVDRAAPPGSVVLVVSNGDGSLLEFTACRGRHFPCTEHETYAGHHPADSAEALRLLEEQRRRGARYLLIPEPSLWWLDHYDALGRHLMANARRLDQDDDAGALFDLDNAPDGEGG